MLSLEEEQQYIQYAQSGDPNAIAYLVHVHLRGAAKAARRYAMRGGQMADLLQEAKIGLMSALRKFEPERGYRFYTYASWYLKQTINDFLFQDAQSSVRFPMTPRYKKFFNNSARYRQLLDINWQAGIATISKELELSEAKTEELVFQFNSFHAMSLSTPLGSDDDGSLTIQDTLIDPAPMLDDQTEDHTLQLQRRAAFYSVFDDLDFRTRDILYHRALADPPEPLHVLAERHQISRERVRQIEVKALEKMRKALKHWEFRHLHAA